MDPNNPPEGWANDVAAAPNKPVPGCVVTAGAPKSDVDCPAVDDEPKSEGAVVAVEASVPKAAGAEVEAPKEKPIFRICQHTTRLRCSSSKKTPSRCSLLGPKKRCGSSSSKQTS